MILNHSWCDTSYTAQTEPDNDDSISKCWLETWWDTKILIWTSIEAIFHDLVSTELISDLPPILQSLDTAGLDLSTEGVMQIWPYPSKWHTIILPEWWYRGSGCDLDNRLRPTRPAWYDNGTFRQDLFNGLNRANCKYVHWEMGHVDRNNYAVDSEMVGLIFSCRPAE